MIIPALVPVTWRHPAERLKTVNKQLLAKCESQRTALRCQVVVANTEPLISCVGRTAAAERQAEDSLVGVAPFQRSLQTQPQ